MDSYDCTKAVRKEREETQKVKDLFKQIKDSSSISHSQKKKKVKVIRHQANSSKNMKLDFSKVFH